MNETIYRKPRRMFEDAGSVNPEESYYVPLTSVTNTRNQDIKTMVDRGRYFYIFAPWQSGKTTFFNGMCDQLHKDPTYIAIILNFQKYEEADKSEFYAQIERKLYPQLKNRLREVNCDKCADVEQFLDKHHLTDHFSFGALFEELNRLIQFKKIVIFIDEFDGIPKRELGNFLTTLRDLYQEYKEIKKKALYSVGLVGIRNITKLVLGGVSPFNIADQVDMTPFSLQNIRDLYGQYTEETHQPFTEAAVKRIHEETGGQTWLVNRLATILTVDIKPGTTDAIDETDVDKAIQKLLKEKNDHFDNLYEKAKLYKESFVEIVFNRVEYDPDDEDQDWLEQYGLIKQSGDLAVVANKIYKARYLKTFFKEVNANESRSLEPYILPANRLDMESVLLDFEQYVARIGVAAFYAKGKPYEKTGQFLLTAWLYQFVKDGEGVLHYEVRSGLGRMDILLEFKSRKYIIETKLNRGNLTRTITDGVGQVTAKYLATESAHEGYLVVYDVKTPAGETCDPRHIESGDKRITCIIIGIGQT